MAGSRLAYSTQLGSFCAHVAHHYSPAKTGVECSDLTTAHRLTLMFPLIFKPNERVTLGLTCPTFPTTNHLLVYAKKCVLYYLPPEFINAITDRQLFSLQLISAISRLFGSLFLEFVPLAHSDLLFKILLGEEGEDEERRAWMQAMREKMQEFHPYEHLLQMICSLTYHISQGRKVVSVAHFMELFARPVMGLVEWPLVIGTRVQFELPPPSSQ